MSEERTIEIIHPSVDNKVSPPKPATSWPSSVPPYVQNLILEAVRPIVGRLDGVILYGSRARGTNHSGSDFDLALVGERLTRADLRAVEEYFYFSPTLYSFDVVMIHEATPALRQAIEREGLLLPV